MNDGGSASENRSYLIAAYQCLPPDILKVFLKRVKEFIHKDPRSLLFEVLKKFDPPKPQLPREELDKKYTDLPSGETNIPKHNHEVLAGAKPLDESDWKAKYELSSNSSYTVNGILYERLNPRSYIDLETYHPDQAQDHAVLYISGHNAAADGMTSISRKLIKQSLEDNDKWKNSVHLELLMPGQGSPLPDGVSGEDLSLGTTYEPAYILQTLRQLKARGITSVTICAESAGGQAVLNALAAACLIDEGSMLHELPRIEGIFGNAPLVNPSIGPMNYVEGHTELLNPKEIDAFLMERYAKLNIPTCEKFTLEDRNLAVANFLKWSSTHFLAFMHGTDNSLNPQQTQQAFDAIKNLDTNLADLMTFELHEAPASREIVHVLDVVLDPAAYVLRVHEFFSQLSK